MLYNRGIQDIPGDANKNNQDYKVYATWCAMYVRCYSNVKQKTRPTYIGTTVCDEWIYYSNFKKWYLNNYIEGYDLDKDIIDGTSKIYSPKTCAFVPNIINSCIIDGNASSSRTYPIGVHYRSKPSDMINEFTNPYQARLCKYKKRVSCGCFSTPEEAHRAWQIAKRDYLLELMSMYCNDVVPEVIQGLQRRVDILNDDIKNNRETKSISKV